MAPDPLNRSYLPPSKEYWFGTNAIGQDFNVFGVTSCKNCNKLEVIILLYSAFNTSAEVSVTYNTNSHSFFLQNNKIQLNYYITKMQKSQA